MNAPFAAMKLVPAWTVLENPAAPVLVNVPLKVLVLVVEPLKVAPAIAGRVRLGSVPNTAAPVPVSSLSVAARSALAPVFESALAESSVTNREAVPALLVVLPLKVAPAIAGRVKLGSVPKTAAPVPVSSESVAARSALAFGSRGGSEWQPMRALA